MSRGLRGAVRGDRLALAIITAMSFLRGTLRYHRAETYLHDDAAYLRRALRLTVDGPPSPGFAPLYVVWQWAESLVVRDSLALWYVNWGVLFAAVLLALYGALRALDVPPMTACAATCAASCVGIFEIGPFVGLFAMALVGAGMVAALRAASTSVALSRFAAVAGVATFVRPELIAAWVVATAAAAVTAVRDVGWARRIAVAVLPILVLAAALGVPIDPTKSAPAFSDHYACNVFHAEHLPGNCWTDGARVVARDFGGPVTVGQALLANPRRVAWHVAQNIRRIPMLAIPLIPPFATRVVRLASGLALAGAVFAGIALFVRRSRTGPRRSALAVAAAAVALSTALASVLYAPRAHYLPPLVMVVLVVALAELGCRVAPGRRSMLACSVAAALSSISMATGARPAPVMQTVLAMRDLRPPPRSVLEAGFGRAVYAGWSAAWVSPAACRPFTGCLAVSPELIVVDEAMREAFAGDPGFARFLADPGGAGYRSVDAGGAPAMLFRTSGTGVPTPPAPSLR